MLPLKNLDALKCLVTASFCNGLSKVKAATDESSNLRIVLEKDADDVQGLTDPLAVSSYLAHNDPVFFKPDQKAEILQWIFYGQSEIYPHVQGYVHFCNDNARDVAFQQKQRKAKLVKSLCFLDTILRCKTFFVGERLTLADTFLAIDILPLFNVTLNGTPLINEICPSQNLTHLKRWHQTIVNQKKFLAVYQPSKFMVKLETKETKKTPKAQSSNIDAKKEVPKILCLHGYRQTSTTFYEKLGAFRKMVGKKCNLTLVNAPHVVTSLDRDSTVPTQDEAEEQRGWWFSQPHGYFKSDDISDCDKGFDESLELIKKTIEEEGPFQGIMGFSQGAALTAMLCMMPEFKFDFAMVFAPFKSVCSKHDKLYRNVDIPTLYVIGDGDQVVLPARQDILSEYFSNATIVRHEGGHFVPATSKQKPAYLKFLEEQNK